MRLLDAIYQILAAADRPLHVDELTSRLLASGLWQTTSKTPERSVGAAVYADIKHHPATTRFVVPARGIFALLPSAEPQPAPAPEPAPEPLSAQEVAAEVAAAESFAYDLFDLIDAAEDAVTAAAEELPIGDAAALDEYLTGRYLEAFAAPAAPSLERQLQAAWAQAPDAAVLRLTAQLLTALGFAEVTADASIETLSLRASYGVTGLLSTETHVRVLRSADAAAPAALAAQLSAAERGLLICVADADEALLAAAAAAGIALLAGEALMQRALQAGIGVVARLELDSAQFADA